MNFLKNNCSFYYKFYTFALARYYGIGSGKLSYKDRLYAYLNLNWQFLPEASDSSNTDITTEFVGTLVSTTSILPTVTSNLFFQNDQDAYDNGIAKNDIYYLSLDNTYGLPFGTPKKLVEDVT